MMINPDAPPVYLFEKGDEVQFSLKQYLATSSDPTGYMNWHVIGRQFRVVEVKHMGLDDRQQLIKLSPEAYPGSKWFWSGFFEPAVADNRFSEYSEADRAIYEEFVGR